MGNFVSDKSCSSVVVEHVRPYVYVVSPVDDYEGGPVYVWEKFGEDDTIRVVGFPVGVPMFFMDAVGAHIMRF